MKLAADGSPGLGRGMNRASRLMAALLALIVVGSLAIILLGNSDAAGPTPKQLAERDVAERLAAAPLPPGAQRVTHLPKPLGLNEPGAAPATPDLVDRGSQFVTSIGAAQTLAWFEANPPAHSKQSGTGTSSSGGKVLSREVTFAWDELPTVRERALLVTVAARPGGGAAFRIDAQAVWIAPHPAAAKVPAAARLLELEYASKGEAARTATVTGSAKVAEYAHLIDTADAAQRGTVNCPEIPTDSPILTLTFRASRGGPVLAEARQQLPPGCGHPLTLTVEGHKVPTLEGSGPLDRRALERLGVKAGQKG
jgi:hypothetical protein